MFVTWSNRARDSTSARPISKPAYELPAGEDAAIRRYVRFGNPYDAVATRNGRTLWLEAKGTETKGAAVIVSRREVQWAREHVGDCVLGVLSDVVFRPDGEVDPESGMFRVFTWYPDGGALSARDYDFTPAEDDRQN
ncbi:hypothetical protein AB0H63_30615 [Micromonospora echinospora]|uniref:hypothetical protein n=1 Tax=Micromonospora echinospora TaxID=1877 RepID=UPI003404262B